MKTLLNLPNEIIYDICDKLDNIYEKMDFLKLLGKLILKKYWKMYFSEIINNTFMKCFNCKQNFIQTQESYFGYDECYDCYYQDVYLDGRLEIYSDF